jgi:hypothetical protein
MFSCFAGFRQVGPGSIAHRRPVTRSRHLCLGIYKAFPAAAVGPTAEAAARLVNAVGVACGVAIATRHLGGRRTPPTPWIGAYGEPNIGWNGLAAAPGYAGRRATRRTRLRTTWRLTAGCRLVCGGDATGLSPTGAATAARSTLPVDSSSAAAGVGTSEAAGGASAGMDSVADRVAPGSLSAAIPPGPALPAGGSLRMLPVPRSTSLSVGSDLATTGGAIGAAMRGSAPPLGCRCQALGANEVAVEVL